MKRNSYLLVGAVLIGGALTVLALQKKSGSSKKDEEITSQSPTDQSTKEPPMEFVTRPDGLKYHIEKHGTGETTPQPGDVVEVHYTGWLDEGGMQGKKFDSSVDRGRPFSFVVGAGQVIKGWDETLLEMKTGEARYIILPPELAYGRDSVPGVIPPHATLRFKVELLKITPKK
jgi:FKBP-type peptidyl-prolyl cis-trans isomerase